jgi:hypothetical protein
LADAEGGLGPYVGVYLPVDQPRSKAAIGVAAPDAGIAGASSMGGLAPSIDATHRKCGVIVAGSPRCPQPR